MAASSLCWTYWVDCLNSNGSRSYPHIRVTDVAIPGFRRREFCEGRSVPTGLIVANYGRLKGQLCFRLYTVARTPYTGQLPRVRQTEYCGSGLTAARLGMSRTYTHIVNRVVTHCSTVFKLLQACKCAALGRRYVAAPSTLEHFCILITKHG